MFHQFEGSEAMNYLNNFDEIIKQITNRQNKEKVVPLQIRHVIVQIQQHARVSHAKKYSGRSHVIIRQSQPSDRRGKN